MKLFLMPYVEYLSEAICYTVSFMHVDNGHSAITMQAFDLDKIYSYVHQLVPYIQLNRDE